MSNKDSQLNKIHRLIMNAKDERLDSPEWVQNSSAARSAAGGGITWAKIVQALQAVNPGGTPPVPVGVSSYQIALDLGTDGTDFEANSANYKTISGFIGMETDLDMRNYAPQLLLNKVVPVQKQSINGVDSYFLLVTFTYLGSAGNQSLRQGPSWLGSAERILPSLGRCEP